MVLSLNSGRICRISMFEEFSKMTVSHHFKKYWPFGGLWSVLKLLMLVSWGVSSPTVESTQIFSPSWVPSLQAYVNYIEDAQKTYLWTRIRTLRSPWLEPCYKPGENVLKSFLSTLVETSAQKLVIPGQDNGQSWWGAPISAWCWVLCSWASLRQSHICCWRLAAYGDPACQAHVVNLSSLIVPMWGFLK